MLDILETFLPFPQRVSQLVALQAFAEVAGVAGAEGWWVKHSLRSIGAKNGID